MGGFKSKVKDYYDTSLHLSLEDEEQQMDQQHGRESVGLQEPEYLRIDRFESGPNYRYPEENQERGIIKADEPIVKKSGKRLSIFEKLQQKVQKEI